MSQELQGGFGAHNRIEKCYSKDRRAKKVAGSLCLSVSLSLSLTHTHTHTHTRARMLRNREAYFDIHSFKNSENHSVLSTILGTGDPVMGRTAKVPVPPELTFIPVFLGGVSPVARMAQVNLKSHVTRQRGRAPFAPSLSGHGI